MAVVITSVNGEENIYPDLTMRDVVVIGDDKFFTGKRLVVSNNFIVYDDEMKNHDPQPKYPDPGKEHYIK